MKQATWQKAKTTALIKEGGAATVSVFSIGHWSPIASGILIDTASGVEGGMVEFKLLFTGACYQPKWVAPNEDGTYPFEGLTSEMMSKIDCIPTKCGVSTRESMAVVLLRIVSAKREALYKADVDLDPAGKDVRNPDKPHGGFLRSIVLEMDACDSHPFDSKTLEVNCPLALKVCPRAVCHAAFFLLLLFGHLCGQELNHTLLAKSITAVQDMGCCSRRVWAQQFRDYGPAGQRSTRTLQVRQA